MAGMNLEAIPPALRAAGSDCWLFHDHPHRDPIGGRILGLDERAYAMRRWYYLVPAEGEPRKLAHCVEPETSDRYLFIAQPTGAHFASQGGRKK
jgi:hypothetical protein